MATMMTVKFIDDDQIQRQHLRKKKRKKKRTMLYLQNGGTLDYVEGNEKEQGMKNGGKTDIITLCTCLITKLV